MWVWLTINDPTPSVATATTNDFSSSRIDVGGRNLVLTIGRAAVITATTNSVALEFIAESVTPGSILEPRLRCERQEAKLDNPIRLRVYVVVHTSTGRAAVVS